MKLKSTSWHKHLNDFVYGDGYSLSQKSGCPYFWGTILSILIVIPTIVYRGMHDALNQGIRTFLVRYGLSIGLIALGLVYIALGINWFQLYFGIGLLAFNLMLHNTNVMERLFGNYIIKRYEKRAKKPFKEKRPHMVVEMFKSWKNKRCPMIQWD